MQAEQPASERLIVYGGTFDPFHNGHLDMARRVSQILEASKVLLVPSYVPPHKQRSDVSSPWHRFAMLVLGTIDDPRFEVDPLELEDPSMPYSVQTAGRLRERYGESTQLFFLMGADMYKDLPNWREVDRFLSLTNVVVTPRRGSPLRRLNAASPFSHRTVHVAAGERPVLASCPQIYLTDCGEIAISSSAIRARVRRNEPIGEEVHPRVAAYIERYGLYRS